MHSCITSKYIYYLPNASTKALSIMFAFPLLPVLFFFFNHPPFYEKTKQTNFPIAEYKNK